MHWLKNSFGVMVAIMLIIVLMMIFLVRTYYYNSAKEYVRSKMNIVYNAAVKGYMDMGGPNFNASVRSYIESYEDKDRIELMALNNYGKVEVTSSGFSPSSESSMPDYEEAKKSSDGFSMQIYELATEEKVVAVTMLIKYQESRYGALRMISSMEKVDKQILIIGITTLAVSFAIMILIFFSGMFFVRSIVYPIRNICDMTRKFAKGDFSERLQKESQDELGQLCDSINYMADELSNTEQMKNEFISSVSHELRTPLTAIKGWTETVTAMYEDKDTFKKGMRVITSETERLSQMVEELLDFSRIQDNRLTLIMDTIDILAELGETVLIYQERARALGITLNYYEPEMLSFVYGDKNRLRQVFINIVDNAIKYSDKGDTVSVEAYEEHGEICISVSDTGLGISKEDLPKVKNKFFKANHTRRGSGIGLAVADEIIQRHGGTLTLNSEEGVGTTVLITLPIIESNKETQTFSNESTNDVRLISSEPQTERIEPVDEQ